MSLRLRRWQLLTVGAMSIVLAVAAWFIWEKWSTPNKASRASQIAPLMQRCQSAMLRDVCGVMKGSAPKASQTRLFIAGIGEVDAQAFAQLRAAGDTMCQELAVKCQAEWSGQACKIGRALYPDLTKPP